MFYPKFSAKTSFFHNGSLFVLVGADGSLKTVMELG